uniref:Uncharacterized protein n=1 Tax=Phytophthora ramorum TaxID=164328 RepID=H3GU53_PHYRM
MTTLKHKMIYLYSTAYTSADYQDATLLYLLWFLTGRNIVRFIRAKTAEEQGLSFFPDDDFSTCPLLAIALAPVTQSSPTASLLSQLSEPQTVSRATLTPATPLIDWIGHPEAVIPLHQTAKKSNESKTADAAPGIHS